MNKLIVHDGELIEQRRLFWRGGSLLFGAIGWLIVFLILPSLLLIALGFIKRSADGGLVWEFTLENYRRLMGFGSRGWSADYLLILLRSVWMATVTTALCLVLAYPLAFFIAGRPRSSRYLYLALVMIPLCTNLVIRTYAWMLILDRRFPPAQFAQWLGLIGDDLSLYPGPFAVYVGMLSNSLPFAVLPLYASVERMDWTLIEAAQDLYAGRRRVFFQAVLPQTYPGLWAAFVLTFIPALGIFVIPDLLGGSKYMLAGNLIQQQFGPSRDWPFGAAICFGLMAVTLLGLYALRRNQSVSGTET